MGKQIILPTHTSVFDKHEKEEELTPLEEFILWHEPSQGDQIWRKSLEELIDYVRETD